MNMSRKRQGIFITFVLCLLSSCVHFVSDFTDNFPSCYYIENVALNKMSNQSDLESGSLAIDNRAETCTKIEPNGQGAWWYVDLGDLHQVYNITVCSKKRFWTKQYFDIRINTKLCGTHSVTVVEMSCITFHCFMIGQYVSIFTHQKESTYTLHLCEVLIMGHQYFIKQRNIAYGKIVTQVGTLNSNESEKAIDLCRNTCVKMDSTLGGTQPEAINMGAWYEIDLGGSYIINEIIICNSNDIEDYNNLHSISLKVDKNECTYYNHTIAKGSCMLFTCSKPVGRWISIKKNQGPNIHKMTVCEIVIFGHPYIENVGYNKKSKYSNIGHNHHTEKVVDSINNHCFYIERTFGYRAWLSVDLESYYEVLDVTVCNSMDNLEYKYLSYFELIIDNVRCYSHMSTVGKGECITINCQMSGRYITINKVLGVRDANRLTICDFQVMGYRYNKDYVGKTCFNKTCGHCETENPMCMLVENSKNMKMEDITLYKETNSNSFVCYVYFVMVLILSLVVFCLYKKNKMCFSRKRKTTTWYKNISSDYANEYIDNCTAEQLIDNRKYDIFISYRTSDDEERCFVVKTLFPRLKEMGYKCCLDVKDFLPGEYISDCITDGIEQSRTTILVISPAFIRGEWPQFEMQVALRKSINRRKPAHRIIPIIFRSIDICRNDISPTLEHILDLNIYLEWTSDSYDRNSEFWVKLKRSLSR